MNRRIESIKLMKGLQPFTQTGVITATTAKQIVDEFVKGNDMPLSDLIYNPHTPMQYINLVQNLKSFIQ